MIYNTFSCETTVHKIVSCASEVDATFKECITHPPEKWNDEHMKKLVAIANFAADIENRRNAMEQVNRWMLANDGNE